MVNKLITLSLALLLTEGIFHTAQHKHNHNQGYGMCDINCGEKNHQTSHHECVKCFNDSSRHIVFDAYNINFDSKLCSLIPNQDYTRKTTPNFHLYCRPPPLVS